MGNSNNPLPSRWGELFDVALSIIEQSNVVDFWTFGGGTALMCQINHRESHDVDLFIDDPQLLPYLNPKLKNYNLAITPTDYSTDGSSSLKIIFDDIGEIDVICCGSVLDDYYQKQSVRRQEVNLELPCEIIAKKIYYRGYQMQPRDVFDIAAVCHVFGNKHVCQSLTKISDQVQSAINTLEKMDRDYTSDIIAQLPIKDEFRPLMKDSIDITLAALRECVNLKNSMTAPLLK